MKAEWLAEKETKQGSWPNGEKPGAKPLTIQDVNSKIFDIAHKFYDLLSVTRLWRIILNSQARL